MAELPREPAMTETAWRPITVLFARSAQGTCTRSSKLSRWRSIKTRLSIGTIKPERSLSDGGLAITGGQDGCLPPDPELRNDLVGIEYGYNARGEIQLEKKEDMKKRGLASPDIADALALTFAQPGSNFAWGLEVPVQEF